MAREKSKTQRFLTGRKAQDRLIPEGRMTGPMPWVIAIMIFLTILAAAAGLALRSATASVNADLAGRVTVQIVEPNPDSRADQAALVEAQLRRNSLVQSVDPVAQEEIRQLISPWLGGGGSADAIGEDIPIPALIDISLAVPATDAVLETLRADLSPMAPGLRVNAHGEWLGPVFDLLSTLQWLALALVLLLAGATAAAVLLAARSALNTNRGTIDVVHLLGGTDSQITRLFQRRIAHDALLGGLAGVLLAGAVLWLVAGQVRQLGSGLLNAGILAWYDWIVLALIPIAGVMLATLTARITVMRALRKML